MSAIGSSSELDSSAFSCTGTGALRGRPTFLTSTSTSEESDGGPTKVARAVFCLCNLQFRPVGATCLEPQAIQTQTVMFQGFQNVFSHYTQTILKRF